MADKTKPTAKPAASKKAAVEKTLSQMIAETPNIFTRCTLIRFHMDIARFMELKQNMASAAPGTEEDLVLAYLSCNYFAAQKHVKAYRNAIQEAEQEDAAEGDTPADKPALAPDIDIISATTVYFFAVNPRIDPSAQDSLQPSDKKALTDIYSEMTAFAQERAEDITDADKLLRAFIDVKHPTREITPTQTSNYTFPLALIPRQIFNPSIPYSGERIPFDTGRNGKSGIMTYLILRPNGEDHLDGTDERIHNALDNLWVEREGSDNQGYCSLNELLKAAVLDVNEENRRTVLRRLWKMNHYEAFIDLQQEIQHFHYPSSTANVIGGRLVSFQTVPIKIKGKVTDQGIYFLQPICCQYSRMRRQMSSTKLDTLHLPGRNTAGKINITNDMLAYIARQYNGLKKTKKTLSKEYAKGADKQDFAKIEKLETYMKNPACAITFEHLYQIADATDAKKQARTRETANDILTDWRRKHVYDIKSVKREKTKFVITFDIDNIMIDE